MTLQEIQGVGLEIMKDIHSFCVNNGIRYSLAYGSLLGAIRHKGFIPWDDDIDIMMPRPDFELFSVLYKSHDCFEMSSVYDAETYVNYTRVYDTRTLVKLPAWPARHGVGVWVDIFPIDGVSDQIDERKKQFENLRHYTSLLMEWRRYISRIHQGKLLTKIKAIYDIIVFKVTNHFESVHRWHDEILKICKNHPFGKTEYCSSLVCVDANKTGRQEVFPASCFSDYQLSSFNDSEFFIVTKYDEILTTIFGDYLKLPPVEERTSHVLRDWVFYWKE